MQSVDIVFMSCAEKLTRAVIARLGLRYAQAWALRESLLPDPVYSDLSITGRNRLQE